MIRIVVEDCANNYQRVTGRIHGCTVAMRERPVAIWYEDLVDVIYATCPGWIVNNRLVAVGDDVDNILDTRAAALLALHGGEVTRCGPRKRKSLCGADGDGAPQHGAAG